MKRIIVMALFLILFVHTCYANSDKPILVIGTCTLFANDNRGVIWPEIFVDASGHWREATMQDVWKGQEFTFLNPDSKVKQSEVLTIAEMPKSLPAELTSKNRQGEQMLTSVVVYTNGTSFASKGIRMIKPRDVSPAAVKEFLRKDTDLKKKLTNVVKLDWSNMKKDFPKQISSQVASFLVADIDGNKMEDYVVVLGEDFGGGEKGPGAVILYLNQNSRYQRIPISSWPYMDSSFPVLLFARDLNGDKAAELFIGDTDGDTTVPYVYSWGKDGLMLVFEGKEPLWSGAYLPKE